MTERSYWVNTVSRDHVQTGAAGGFVQADHGKNTRLKQLAKGDLLVFYSPKTKYVDGEKLQAFTALAKIIDDEPFQVEMTSTFHPWRRKTTFLDTKEAVIRPLIENLSFIPDKQRWGFPFRRGLFKVEEADFKKIAEAMSADLTLHLASSL